MTAIIGMERDGVAYIGADSAASSDDLSTVIAEPKVFRKGEYVIGYSYSFRFGNLLQHAWDAPGLPESLRTNPAGIDAFMVNSVAQSIHTLLESRKALRSKDSNSETGCALIAIRGRLYEYERDGYILRTKDGIAATGSAYIALLASIKTLHSCDWAAAPGGTGAMDVPSQLLAALRVAEDLTPSRVRAPFRVMGTNGVDF